MILLTGDNSFEIARALADLKADYTGDIETHDGEALSVSDLPSLLMGGTLFASRRMIILKNVSQHKSLWADFADWLDRVDDDVTLVLVEPALDKRTKTAKQLLKQATVQEYKAWTDRDRHAAEQWVVDEMTRQGGTIDHSSARHLVQRVGVDQWLLFHALQKLIVLDTVTPAVIDDVVELSPSQSVFVLFELALRGDGAGISAAIKTLALTEDPYRLMGLLGGQAFHLAVLAVGTKPEAQIAKDIKAHPFALSKLSSAARRLGPAGARQVIAAFAEADKAIKSSGQDPWLLIERALMKLSRLR